MAALWFTEKEDVGFPTEKAAVGCCDLSVLHVGGEWQWLVTAMLAAMFPKVLREVLSMQRNGTQRKARRSRSVDRSSLAHDRESLTMIVSISGGFWVLLKRAG
jgi:hypothetical protein